MSRNLQRISALLRSRRMISRTKLVRVGKQSLTLASSHHAITIPVTITFDKRNIAEGDPIVIPARKEYVPREIYIKPWMMEIMAIPTDAWDAIIRRLG